VAGREQITEVAMKPHRRFARLSRGEREFLEMVLLEEMERQVWFGVSYSEFFGCEIFLPLQ
jgi:hypothetical protein